MNIKLDWSTEDIVNYVREEFDTQLSEDQANNILERFNYYSNHPDETKTDYNLIDKCYFAWQDGKKFFTPL